MSRFSLSDWCMAWVRVPFGEESHSRKCSTSHCIWLNLGVSGSRSVFSLLVSSGCHSETGFPLLRGDRYNIQLPNYPLCSRTVSTLWSLDSDTKVCPPSLPWPMRLTWAQVVHLFFSPGLECLTPGGLRALPHQNLLSLRHRLLLGKCSCTSNRDARSFDYAGSRHLCISRKLSAISNPPLDIDLSLWSLSDTCINHPSLRTPLRYANALLQRMSYSISLHVDDFKVAWAVGPLLVPLVFVSHQLCWGRNLSTSAHIPGCCGSIWLYTRFHELHVQAPRVLQNPL